MKIPPEKSFKLKQLLFITLYWVVMVRTVVVLEFYGLEKEAINLIDINLFEILRQNMIIASLSGLAIGLLTGFIELFVFQQYFRNKSFYRLILTKLFVYLFCIGLISMVSLFYYQKYILGFDILESAFSVLKIMTTNGFYHLLIVGLLLSSGINFLLFMQNKIGIGSFVPILFGKYHRPKEEDRIFLFLDLKSSTRMAEKLGHEKYSEMIQECYRDLSDLVLKYRGIIYQFVGDEAVISWKTKRVENYANSVRLFLAFQEVLDQKSKVYQLNYGVLPRFKAAINSGNVMVAEVGGSMKSEIAYHGDVLNTASRMMELCKFYQKDLVISESVNKNIIPGSCNAEIALQGEIQLRGKNTKLNVFSVTSLTQQRSLSPSF